MRCVCSHDQVNGLQSHNVMTSVSVCLLQVFYPDADDVTAAAATCDPWHGQVADVLSHDGEGQGRGEASHSGDPEAGGGEQRVQVDPYGCGGLWERFLVHWQPNTQVGRLVLAGCGCYLRPHCPGILG